MKKYLALLTVTLLMLSPAIAGAEIGQATADGPPIAQKLVREGDFAVELTDVFNLGPVGTEEEAESVLTSVGIAPRNGWVSDYPVTPDVIGELQAVIAAAADSNALGMYREHALAAFGDLLDQLGLPPITTDDSDQYTEDTQPPMSAETGSYVDSGGLVDYYGGLGPPVVTYYTPPSPYYPLYSWVSYPFWCGRSFFRGFFVLRRFNCPIPVALVRHHGSRVVIISRPVRKVVTNRVIDPASHKAVIIDPPRRSTDPTFRLIPSTPTAKFVVVQPGSGSSAVTERSHTNQARNPSTQAVVVKGSLGRGTPSTSQGPKIVPPPRVAKPDGDSSRAQSGNPTTVRSSRVSSGQTAHPTVSGQTIVATVPVGPRIRVFSPTTAGLPQARITPERGQNPTLPGHNRDRMVSPTDRGLVQRREQPSFSQATGNEPTGVISSRNSSQVVGRSAVPRSTEMLPANRGSAPERSGSVGYGWGNAGTGFGAGRMETFGSRGGFGRR
jgi:hypothetical protein